MNKNIKKILFILLFVLIICIIILGIYFTNNKFKSENEIKTKELEEQEKIVTFKDDYFMTQINEIYYNPDDYVGKKIEIEGFPMESPDGYKFVGRYGPGCCGNDGYVYLEYVYNKENIPLVVEKDWIKVKGTIKKIVDQTGTVIYIEATSVEKLSTRGVDRVVK